MVCFHFQSFFFCYPNFSIFLFWNGGVCEALHMKHSGHAGLSGNSSTSTKSCGFLDCQAERNGEGSLWDVTRCYVVLTNFVTWQVCDFLLKFTSSHVHSHCHIWLPLPCTWLLSWRTEAGCFGPAVPWEAINTEQGDTDHHGEGFYGVFNGKIGRMGGF